MSDGFDWNDDDDGSLLIWEQPATAVYMNPCRHIVIRQRAEVFEDDPFVTFDLAYMPLLIRRLQELLEEAEFNPAEHEPELLRSLGLDPRTGTALKQPMTAAERQRKFKQRRRVSNGEGNERKRKGNEAALPDDQPTLSLAAE